MDPTTKHEPFAVLLRRAALSPDTLTVEDWRRLYWDEPTRSPDEPR